MGPDQNNQSCNPIVVKRARLLRMATDGGEAARKGITEFTVELTRTHKSVSFRPQFVRGDSGELTDVETDQLAPKLGNAQPYDPALFGASRKLPDDTRLKIAEDLRRSACQAEQNVHPGFKPFRDLASARHAHVRFDNYLEVIKSVLNQTGLPAGLFCDEDGALVKSEPLHDIGHREAIICMLHVLGARGPINAMNSSALVEADIPGEDWLRFLSVSKHRGDVEACRNIIRAGHGLGYWEVPGAGEPDFERNVWKLAELYQRIKSAAMLYAICDESKNSLDEFQVFSGLHENGLGGDSRAEVAEQIIRLRNRKFNLEKVEGAEALLSWCQERHVPIVICTGGARRTAIAQLKAAGLWRYLCKTVNGVIDSASGELNVFAADDEPGVNCSKPAPRLYLRGIDRVLELHAERGINLKEEFKGRQLPALLGIEDQARGARALQEALAKRGLGENALVFLGNMEDPHFTPPTAAEVKADPRVLDTYLFKRLTLTAQGALNQLRAYASQDTNFPRRNKGSCDLTGLNPREVLHPVVVTSKALGEEGPTEIVCGFEPLVDALEACFGGNANLGQDREL